MKIFSGRRFAVEKRKMVLPNGHTANVEMAHSLPVAVTVPFLDKETVIMLKQYRPVVGRWLLEFPAGLVEGGKTQWAAPEENSRKRLVTEPTA